jgi:hypothetical protein
MRELVKGIYKIFLFIIIAISIGIAVFVSIQFGIKIGLFTGGLAFLMLGGVEIAYFYNTSKSNAEREGVNLRKSITKFNKDTENNPTLR